jgi:hypothetical protein
MILIINGCVLLISRKVVPLSKRLFGNNAAEGLRVVLHSSLRPDPVDP